jgi:hypothetical protein
MNALNYQRHEPISARLKRQYQQQDVRVFPIPQMYTAPVQHSIAPGTELAWLVAGGSAAVLLWVKGNKVQKIIATSVLQTATAAAVTPFFQTHNPR